MMRITNTESNTLVSCKIELTYEDGIVITSEGIPKEVCIKNLSINELPNYDLGLMEFETREPLLIQYNIIIELPKKEDGNDE